MENAFGHLTGLPKLVIEVLASKTDGMHRAREIKLNLRAIWGAQEYWVADNHSKQLKIYRHHDAELTLRVGDTLTSPLLSEFAYSIKQFFDSVLTVRSK